MERHFSDVIVKDKKGNKTNKIIQKSIGMLFEFRIDDGSDTKIDSKLDRTQHHLKAKNKPITMKIKLILFSFLLNSTVFAQYKSIRAELLEVTNTEFINSINPLGKILENHSGNYIFEYNELILNSYSVVDEQPIEVIQFEILKNIDKSIYFNRYKEYYDKIGTYKAPLSGK